MIGIVIVTHGLFGEELYQSAELILGKQGDVYCLSVMPGKAISEVAEDIDKIIQKSGANGIIILTDMFGGSPSNIAFSYAGKEHVEIISGVNMPMLIKMFTGRLAGEKLKELAASCKEAAVNSIKIASEIIKK